ncbi:MAG: hypothetical protein ABJN22_04205 [Litorimonas sp.]
MTLTLAMVVKALVTTEFVPQSTDRNTRSTAVHIYESIVIICGGYRGIERSGGPRFPILVPPYTRVISHPYMENPHDDRRAYVAPKPENFLTKPDIDIRSVSVGRLSCQGSHNVRVPPKFPKAFLEGNSSGLCKVSFLYDENGQAADVDVQNCTHATLESPTRIAVAKWQRGAGVCHSALSGQRQFSTLRYDLMDEAGNLLPLP